MAPSLEFLGSLLATYLVHSTLLIGGVALLNLWRRPSPGLRQAAWKWAMVVGWLTSILQTSLQAEPWSGVLLLDGSAVAHSREQSPGHNPRTRQRPRFAQAMPPAQFPTLTKMGPHATRATPAAAKSSTRSNTSTASTKRGLAVAPRAASSGGISNLLFVLALVWSIALGWGLLRLALVWRSLRCRHDLTELSRGPHRALLDELCESAGLGRRVRLYRCARNFGPVAWGFFSAQIAVPARILDRLARPELRALLAHELAHLARGDTRWLWLGSLIQTVGNFQPLNRLAQRAIRKEAETLCDSWAIRHTGDRLALARSLTMVAELTRLPSPALSASAVEGRSHLGLRVARLLGELPMEDVEPKRPGRWSLLAGGCTCAIATLLMVPSLRVVVARPPASRAVSTQFSRDAANPRTARSPRADSVATSRGEPNESDLLNAADLWGELELVGQELAEVQTLLTRQPENQELAAAAERLLGRWRQLQSRAEHLRGVLIQSQSISDSDATAPP